jgi:hypothetical protein
VRAVVLALLVAGCDLVDPEVVVVNLTSADLQLGDLSYSGCAWPTVLTYGEATSVGRCLPGDDRVHFKKLDLSAAIPLWFPYQTATAHRVDRGDFMIIEITLDDIEQDFSVPGPYGH